MIDIGQDYDKRLWDLTADRIYIVIAIFKKRQTLALKMIPEIQ